MIFNMTGGGASLNFKVVGGTTQPTDPKENTIWVNTSTAITDWVFSATQPTAASGRVWISTGQFSNVEFNALKKNGIQVYPLSAKQYVSGAWKDVEAKSYQNGEWKLWIQYLYNAGDMMEEITGGYVAEAKQFNAEIGGAGVPTIATDSPGKMVLYYDNPSGNSGLVRTAKKINLTGYSTLHFAGTIPGNELGLYGVFVWTNIGKYIVDNVVASIRPTATLTGETSVSLEGVTGDCYIGFTTRNQWEHFIVERVWLT